MPPTRRIEDKIRGLCARAVRAEDPSEMTSILSELQITIRELSDRLRTMAAVTMIAPGKIPIERRKYGKSF